MATLTLSASLDAVYQLETTDPVLGGPGGISNLPNQNLGNRTQYILERLNALLNGGGTKVLLAKVEGAGTAAGRNIGLAAGNAMEVGAFGLGGNATSITNCDVAINGFNIVQAGAANMPANEAGFGMLINWSGVETVNGIGGVKQQILMAGSRVYFRQFLTDTWGGWEFISITDDVGSVSAFAVSVAPLGWLRCNGALVSRTSYAKLFARIGVAFGAGDGSTTFQLPDLRGRFVRGYDNGANLDPGRLFATTQADGFASHHHVLQDVNAGGGGVDGFDLAPVTNGSLGGISTTNISDFGDVETRPKNLALMFAIKYR